MIIFVAIAAAVLPAATKALTDIVLDKRAIKSLEEEEQNEWALPQRHLMSDSELQAWKSGVPSKMAYAAEMDKRKVQLTAGIKGEKV